jgi:hypothetical protein
LRVDKKKQKSESNNNSLSPFPPARGWEANKHAAETKTQRTAGRE